MVERKITKRRQVKVEPEPEEAEEVTEVETVSEDEEAFEHGGEEESEEEEPQEEEEAPEEEARPVKRRTKPPVKKSGSGKKVIALLVVVILVAVVVYVVAFPPATLQSPPTAKITAQGVDPSDLKAGMPVTFDGTSSKSNQMSGDKKINKYAWDFGDGTTGEGATIVHTFLTKGAKKVKLTVTDSAGKSGSTTMNVNVNGAVVIIPMAKFGDTISYSLSGTVDINNPDGYLTYHYTEGQIIKTHYTVKVTKVHINIDTGKGAEASITTSSGQAEDGFDQTHSCVNRNTDQKVPFNGYAIATVVNDGTGIGTPLNESITGNGNLDETVCSDLNTNSTVKTTRTDSYNINVGSGVSGTSRSGTDAATLYPKKRQEFNVDALRDNRTFKSGDSGSHTFQDTTVNWAVVDDQAAVLDTPCIELHITMDQDTMQKNGFSAFDMYVWISSASSFPLKLQLLTEASKDGNAVKVNYNAVAKSFNSGSSEINFGAGLTGPFMTKRADIEYEAPDTYGPAMGTSDPSLTAYPLPDAVTFAKAQSSGLQNYLSSHSDAFLTDAYYNKSSGNPTWNLTFGVKNSSSAYNVIVTQAQVLKQGSASINDVGRSIKDYSSAVTFAGAEKVLQGRSDIKSKVYSGSSIDTTKYNFGCTADVPYPAPALPINTNVLAIATEYYFFVEEKDGKYSAGVDAQTGQVLFVVTHTGN
jgi:hypothetical protein